MSSQITIRFCSIPFNINDPEQIKRERYARFNAYLPPITKLRSYEISKSLKKDIHILNVGAVVFTAKKVNFKDVKDTEHNILRRYNSDKILKTKSCIKRKIEREFKSYTYPSVP